MLEFLRRIILYIAWPMFILGMVFSGVIVYNWNSALTGNEYYIIYPRGENISSIEFQQVYESYEQFCKYYKKSFGVDCGLITKGSTVGCKGNKTCNNSRTITNDTSKLLADLEFVSTYKDDRCIERIRDNEEQIAVKVIQMARYQMLQTFEKLKIEGLVIKCSSAKIIPIMLRKSLIDDMGWIVGLNSSYYSHIEDTLHDMLTVVSVNGTYELRPISHDQTAIGHATFYRVRNLEQDDVYAELFIGENGTYTLRRNNPELIDIYDVMYSLPETGCILEEPQ